MKKIILSGLVLAAVLTSCDNSKKTTDTAITDSAVVVETIVETVVETENEMSDEQKQEMVQKIDAQKAEIETKIKDVKPTELKTTALREQLKQKWEKLHFYTNAEGQVIRVKTYPYDKVSKRTEEFYFQDGKLILAVIEDDGTGEAGKEKEKLNKLYYFNEEKPFHEINNSGETEYSIKESDAERLLEEANEYLKLKAEKM